MFGITYLINVIIYKYNKIKIYYFIKKLKNNLFFTQVIDLKIKKIK
jgi:hypothetical protein